MEWVVPTRLLEVRAWFYTPFTPPTRENLKSPPTQTRPTQHTARAQPHGETRAEFENDASWVGE